MRNSVNFFDSLAVAAIFFAAFYFWNRPAEKSLPGVPMHSDTVYIHDTIRLKPNYEARKLRGISVVVPDTIKRFVDSVVTRAKKVDSLESEYRRIAQPYRTTYEDSTIKIVTYHEPITRSAHHDTINIKPIPIQKPVVNNTFEVEAKVPWYERPVVVVAETVVAILLIKKAIEEIP
jgi:hypothetical protein